ncbi:hypothetical protein H6G33_03985 [Calothrix sp. FACHB-1219]|uniref:hypothetical protein n=1 Tax=unclassified Calothrix TaxID=2619626 RepID=UPI001687A313|nr:MULTISPECIES: hypothetical protein [unclassified Calothrix]MBD2204985.1 hypothetical protein [Calothrix sp. FACHB-168]MBD2216191.1 hypothetical protein [Calothrix sp. FACHB-1219]
MNVPPQLQQKIEQENSELQMQAKIEEYLIAGLESGEVAEVNNQWWEQKRTHLINQLHKNK